MPKQKKTKSKSPESMSTCPRSDSECSGQDRHRPTVAVSGTPDSASGTSSVQHGARSKTTISKAKDCASGTSPVQHGARPRAETSGTPDCASSTSSVQQGARPKTKVSTTKDCASGTSSGARTATPESRTLSSEGQSTPKKPGFKKRVKDALSPKKWRSKKDKSQPSKEDKFPVTKLTVAMPDVLDPSPLPEDKQNLIVHKSEGEQKHVKSNRQDISELTWPNIVDYALPLCASADYNKHLHMDKNPKSRTFPLYAETTTETSSLDFSDVSSSIADISEDQCTEDAEKKIKKPEDLPKE